MSESELWNLVVNSTKTHSEDLDVVRVVLHILLTDRKPPRFADHARSIKSMMSLLVRKPAATPRWACDDAPWFIFPYNTASTVSNLAPVLQAFQTRLPVATVIAPPGVALPGSSLRNCDTKLTSSSLLAIAPLKERYVAAISAVNAYKKLRRSTAHIDKAHVSVIARNKVKLISEFLLGGIASRATRTMLRSYRPRFLISTSDLWPFERSIFQEFRRVGIPTFVIQHGVVNPCWHPSPTESILVWGNVFRDEMCNIGFPRSRLAVCGMPSSDMLFRQAQTAPGVPATGAVLFLSHTHAQKTLSHVYANYGEFVREVVLSRPNVRWMVKLHPSETDEFYRALGDDVHSRLEILPKSTSLRDALLRCDCACTLFSTAALEAMMLGRPSIILNIDQEIARIAWWPREGGGLYARGASQFAGLVDDLLSNAAVRQRIVKDQLTFLDNAFANHGRAAQAVVDYVEANSRAHIHRSN